MKEASLITWGTYACRISNRVPQNKQYRQKSIRLSQNEEMKITEIIRNIVFEDDLKVLAYNICIDHVHMVMVCEEDELSKIVQKLKSVSARFFNIWKGRTRPTVNTIPAVNTPSTLNRGACSPVHNKKRGIAQNHLWARNIFSTMNASSTVNTLSIMNTPFTLNRGACSPVHNKKRGITQNHLWARRFNISYIYNDKQLFNAVEYVNNNREKHNLPKNKKLSSLIQTFLCEYHDAF